MQSSVTTDHCAGHNSPVTPKLNLFCSFMASLRSIFMPVAAHMLTRSISHRQWFLHEQLWTMHSTLTCWIHNYECSYWKHTTAEVMLFQAENRNYFSACVRSCPLCVELWNASRSLLDSLSQKLWKSRKNSNAVAKMRGIRDKTSKLAELGIELRSEINYPSFQLNSLSDQNHPLQLGIKCLALLPNNCNPAIV